MRVSARAVLKRRASFPARPTALCMPDVPTRPMDPHLHIKALVDTLAPRTAHQYKLYHTKFIQWCRDNKLLRRDPGADHPYRDIVVTATLVHCFVLSQYVCVSDSQFSASVLRKMISAFKFLHRVCCAYEPDYPYELDHDYLEAVARLHVSASAENPPFSPLHLVSVNMWTPHSNRLSEKYFKGGLERLRFLVDFHVQQYWHLPFADRARLKLGDLRFAADPGMLHVVRQAQHGADAPETVQQLALLPQRVPWVCPLVSLAAYLYLRFYGAPKAYKGDGFPDLLGTDEWAFLPLVRGKSLDKYPREETMTNYYAHVFRHCHLPYKRREYFYNKSVDYCQYPEIRRTELDQLQEIAPAQQRELFPHLIPLDFLRHMNHFPVYEPPSENHYADLANVPKSLLVQVFPEIEEYKRSSIPLGEQAQHFIDALQLLRSALVSALPLFYHFFPEHDLFKDPMFQNAEFQGYFHQKIEQLRATDQLQSYDPAAFGLVEAERDFAAPSQPPQALDVPPSADTQDLQIYLRDQTFRMVQFQTTSNFHLLLQSLSRIFEKLETKKSNREYIIHQLGSLEQTLQDQIAASKPQDVKTEEETSSSSTNGPKQETRESLPAGKLSRPAVFDSDAEDDDDYKEEDDNEDNDDEVDPNLQNELQALVSQVMDTRFKSAVEQQTAQIERHVQSLISAQVKEEVRKQLAHLLNQQSSTPTPQPSQQPVTIAPKRPREEQEPPSTAGESTFAMSPQLTSIEDIILEWFTPNPEQGNECVHTMNKKFGKTWRAGSQEATHLYKQRKLIIEFYICLVNQRQMDRYEAVAVCEKLRDNASIQEFSNMLKSWKKGHNNSFDGLG